MEFLQSVGAFVVAIGVLVTVHEFGHFWVARRLGVKVLKFSIGFGRPLLSWRAGRDRTEYAIAMIPLGGYVKMLDEREGAIGEAERARAFNRQSLGVRTAVVLAGPLANFLFAVVAYWLMFVIGVTGLRALVGDVAPGSVAARAGLQPGDAVVRVEDAPARSWEAVVQGVIGRTLEGGTIRLAVVDEEGRERERELDLSRLALDDLTQGQFFDAVGITPARPVIPPVIGYVEPGGQAARAGFLEGDVVVSADGQAIDTWMDWVAFVRARPDQDVAVSVRRNGVARTLVVRPAAVASADGEIGRIGAGPLDVDRQAEGFYVTERYPIGESVAKAALKSYEITRLTLGVFWKMLQLEVSVRNLSGPISIAQYAGYSAEIGAARFLEFLAIVSISLGILNLLPIPVLDGGHLLYHLVELVKGKPLSEQAQAIGQQVGIVLLVGLMGLAFYNDLARLLG